MGSFKSCLNKARKHLQPEDVEFLESVYPAKLKQHGTESQASVDAVMEFINKLENERAELVDFIRAEGGQVNDREAIARSDAQPGGSGGADPTGGRSGSQGREPTRSDSVETGEGSEATVSGERTGESERVGFAVDADAPAIDKFILYIQSDPQLAEYVEKYQQLIEDGLSDEQAFKTIVRDIRADFRGDDGEPRRASVNHPAGVEAAFTAEAVDESTDAEAAARGVKNNNHGVDQAARTRRTLNLRFPTQQFKAVPSGRKNGRGEDIFNFVVQPRLFDDREAAEHYATQLNARYPNSFFELEPYPEGFALTRFNVTDPSLKAEIDDASRVYAEDIGKILNNGFTAVRQKDAQKVIWLRNPVGTKMPLHAQSITAMGLRTLDDQQDVRSGYLTGVGMLLAHGWTMNANESQLMSANYDIRGGNRFLDQDPVSKGADVKTKAEDAERLAAIDESANDWGYLTSASVKEVLETFEMSPNEQTVFLLAQGLDDLIYDPQGETTGTSDATGTLADEAPRSPREFDEFTGEVLHPPEDSSPRDAKGRKIKGTRVSKRLLEANREVERDRQIARALARVSVKSTGNGTRRPGQVTAEQAEQVKQDFLASLNGNLDMDIHMIEDFSVISNDPDWQAQHGRSHGYIANLGGGRYAVVVQTGVHASEQDLLRTLRHEVLAHAGLARFFTNAERQQLINLVKAAQTSTLKAEWDRVRKNYPESSESVQAEEVIAAIAEKPQHPVYLRIKRFFERVLNRLLGRDPNAMTRTRIAQIINQTFEWYKAGAKQRGSGRVTEDVRRDTSASDLFEPSRLRHYGTRIKQFLGGDLPRILPFIFTADRELRTMGDIGKQLADLFSQQTSSIRHAAVGVQSYFQGVANARARWNRQWEQIVEDINDAEVLNAALEELSRAPENSDPAKLSPTARRINDFFHRYRRAYLLPRFGPDFGELRVYFPRVYDLEAIEKNPDRFREVIREHVMQNVQVGDLVNDVETTVESIVDNILGSGGSVEFSLTTAENVISPGFSGRHERMLRGDKLNQALNDEGFIHANNAEVVRNYIASSTKFAEFTRVNGGPDGTRIKDLIEKLPTMAERDRARQLVEGYLGRTGLHTDQRLVKGMSWVMVYQSYLTLAFAAVASIPDFAGPIMRSRNMSDAWAGLKTVAGLFGQFGDAKERARLLGILNERMTHQALKEAYGQSKADAGSQRALDKLFKYNGQEWLTNTSRVISMTVAEQFLLNNAERAQAGDARAQRYLEELNVTVEQIQTWDAEGRQPWSPDLDSEATNAVQDAIYQFIDESVIRPNASQRPLWANHPALMLLWHLKSFFYAYGKIVLGGLARESVSRYREAGTEGRGQLRQLGEAGVPFAIAGMMLFPLAVLARELRELIQYAGQDDPTEDEEPLEYVWQRLRDGGILGPLEIVLGANRFADNAGEAALGLAGPAFQHAYQLFGDDANNWSDIKRSTPVMNQVPWLNDFVKDSVTGE